jgi:hypothetical protein
MRIVRRLPGDHVNVQALEALHLEVQVNPGAQIEELFHRSLI